MTPVPMDMISKIPPASSRTVVHVNVVFDAVGNATFSPPGPPPFRFRKDTSKTAMKALRKTDQAVRA